MPGMMLACRYPFVLEKISTFGAAKGCRAGAAEGVGTAGWAATSKTIMRRAAAAPDKYSIRVVNDFMSGMLKFPDPDIAEPGFKAMILQVDMPVAEAAEIRPLPEFAAGDHRAPLVIPKRGRYDIYAIEIKLQFAAPGIDLGLVPFPY